MADTDQYYYLEANEEGMIDLHDFREKLKSTVNILGIMINKTSGFLSKNSLL